MQRFVIVVGDKTSHGGVVISGSTTTEVDGRKVARTGDKVTCPRKGHGGITRIVSGDSTCLIDGEPVARQGDRTACGAILFSSQTLAAVDVNADNGQEIDAGGLESDSGDNAPLSAATHESGAFDEQVELTPSSDAAPEVGLPWFVKTADGRTFKGRLNDTRRLPRIVTSTADVYEVYWGDEALHLAEGEL